MTSQANDHLVGAQRFAARFYPAAADRLCRGPRQQRDRIRLAYVCGEFREHATSQLMASLFENHDRGRFETFGISTGINDQSTMRKRIEAAFDVFIDGQLKSDRALAELLHRSEIDILVNLNGYYGAERTGIFALRPCPIQVNYLGFPGTMGAEYIDYIIADKIVIPQDQQSAYTEKVVYLPECYQVNDSQRRASSRAPTRADADLPPTGFVFCCCNKNNKILPEMFDSWVRILQQVDASVLWLMGGSTAVVRNLRREAESRGIGAERLVFAPWTPPEDHLARYQLADLFLDTLPYGAHTTASDALWAGVPVLTRLGPTFAGRVAASVLQAIGLPELITHSIDEYETLAARLATDSSALTIVKSKLAQNRSTHSLFNTSRFCRHIERAYIAMWQRCQQGQSAAGFAIHPDPTSGTPSATPTQRG
jgi:protein O-GlcNAc transferase